MGLSPGSRMNPGRGHGAEKSDDLVEKPFCEQLKAMGGSGWKAALMCPN